MKIYILTDLEGVSGVVTRDQVFAGNSGYEKARDWLTADVNAAVEGAVAGGATEVIVLDGHGANSAVNIRYENIHPKACLIQGSPWRDYLELLDGSFGGLFQIGAHAMSGTAGAVLEHTMSSDSWVEMTLNGRPTGEIGLCAAVAGYHGVPFIMMSGDDKAAVESQKLSPGVETAVVKHAISRGCALLLPRETVDEIIRDCARRAVLKAKEVAPVTIETPVAIEVEYLRNDMVERILEREGVTKLSARRVRYTGRDLAEAARRWRGG
jgi:D-amino peptidase